MNRPNYTENPKQPLTSMGFTVIVKAESSQVISESCASSAFVLWWAARILITPKTIMNSKKPTQTTTIMVTACDPLAATAPRWSDGTYSLETTAAGLTSIECLLTVACAGAGSFGCGWITVNWKDLGDKVANRRFLCLELTHGLYVFVWSESSV